MIDSLLTEIQERHGIGRDAAVLRLADHLGRSRMTIYGWLSGKTVPDTIQTILKLTKGDL